MVKIMLQAAHEKLSERLEDLELKIVRHQYMLDNSREYRPLGVMYAEKLSHRSLRERQKELNDCRQWHYEYRETLQAIMDLGQRMRDMEHKAFAQWVAERYATNAQQQGSGSDSHQ